MAQIDSARAKQERSRREWDRLQRLHDEQTKYINRFLVEVHKKYSIPVACLVFVLIGAPLGIKARSGGMGMGTAYSMAFFLIYWACFIGGETLADKNIISPFWAMWTPNILVGAFGILLLIAAVRETTPFSYNWLGSWAKRLGLPQMPSPERPDRAENGSIP
jgi:lipopolysaccharide export system permease protein